MSFKETFPTGLTKQEYDSRSAMIPDPIGKALVNFAKILTLITFKEDDSLAKVRAKPFSSLRIFAH